MFLRGLLLIAFAQFVPAVLLAQSLVKEADQRRILESTTVECMLNVPLVRGNPSADTKASWDLSSLRGLPDGALVDSSGARRFHLRKVGSEYELEAMELAQLAAPSKPLYIKRSSLEIPISEFTTNALMFSIKGYDFLIEARQVAIVDPSGSIQKHALPRSFEPRSGGTSQSNFSVSSDSSSEMVWADTHFYLSDQFGLLLGNRASLSIVNFDGKISSYLMNRNPIGEPVSSLFSFQKDANGDLLIYNSHHYVLSDSTNQSILSVQKVLPNGLGVFRPYSPLWLSKDVYVEFEGRVGRLVGSTFQPITLPRQAEFKIDPLTENLRVVASDGISLIQVYAKNSSDYRSYRVENLRAELVQAPDFYYSPDSYHANGYFVFQFGQSIVLSQDLKSFTQYGIGSNPPTSAYRIVALSGDRIAALSGDNLIFLHSPHPFVNSAEGGRFMSPTVGLRVPAPDMPSGNDAQQPAISVGPPSLFEFDNNVFLVGERLFRLVPNRVAKVSLRKDALFPDGLRRLLPMQVKHPCGNFLRGYPYIYASFKPNDHSNTLTVQKMVEAEEWEAGASIEQRAEGLTLNIESPSDQKTMRAQVAYIGADDFRLKTVIDEVVDFKRESGDLFFWVKSTVAFSAFLFVVLFFIVSLPIAFGKWDRWPRRFLFDQNYQWSASGIIITPVAWLCGLSKKFRSALLRPHALALQSRARDHRLAEVPLVFRYDSEVPARTVLNTDLPRLFMEERKIWIRGSAGMGKTALAERVTDVINGDGSSVCVLVRLRNLSPAAATDNDPLLDLVVAALGVAHRELPASDYAVGPNGRIVGILMGTDSLFVVLDGANEVPLGIDINGALAKFVRKHPTVNLMVTSQYDAPESDAQSHIFRELRLPADLVDYREKVLTAMRTQEQLRMLLDRTPNEIMSRFLTGYDLRLLCALQDYRPDLIQSLSNRTDLFLKPFSFLNFDELRMLCAVALSMWKAKSRVFMVGSSLEIALDKNVFEKVERGARWLVRSGSNPQEHQFQHDLMRAALAANYIATTFIGGEMKFLDAQNASTRQAIGFLIDRDVFGGAPIDEREDGSEVWAFVVDLLFSSGATAAVRALFWLGWDANGNSGASETIRKAVAAKCVVEGIEVQEFVTAPH